MATAYKKVVGEGIFILPERTHTIESALLAAGSGAAATLEIFEGGTVGILDDVSEIAIDSAGTKYEVGDQIAVDPGNGGTPLILEVATVDTAGEILTVTLVQAGNGFASGVVYPTELHALNGGEEVGALLTAVVNAPGTDYEVDDEITLSTEVGGVAATIKVDTVDTGGEILTFTILTKGAWYVEGETYTVSGGSGNDDATFDAQTVAGDGEGAEIEASTPSKDSDAGSVAKLAAVQSTSETAEICLFTSQKISVIVTGTNAQGYVYYK